MPKTIQRKGIQQNASEGSTTLATSVSARLREAILDGEMEPGSRLSLRELTESFGVSLSPLREALSRLATEKLVYVEDQRGFQVAPVSAADCREIGRIRVELEALALGESIRNGDDEWESNLVAAFHMLGKKKMSERLENRSEWEQAHRRFHQALIAASGMPLLNQMCGTLNDMADRYRRLFLIKRAPSRDVPGEHLAIYTATLERNVDKASASLRAHIERTCNAVVEVLKDENTRIRATRRAGRSAR